jgi:hypothetical protein
MLVKPLIVSPFAVTMGESVTEVFDLISLSVFYYSLAM